MWTEQLHWTNQTHCLSVSAHRLIRNTSNELFEKIGQFKRKERKQNKHKRCYLFITHMLACERSFPEAVSVRAAGPPLTCVFVFVPQQGAALLEHLGAEVAGVHAVLQTALLGGRGRVRVVLLLHRRRAL